MINARSYGCAGHIGGRLCPGTIHSVKRPLVESRILESLTPDLSEPAAVSRLEALVATRLLDSESGEQETTSDPAVQAELLRLGQHIGAGQANAAILARVAELTECLRTAPVVHVSAARMSNAKARNLSRMLVARMRANAAMIHQLHTDGEIERARECLRALVGTIRLIEDSARSCLVAEFDLGTAPLDNPKSLTTKLSENVVAGAGFEPATFGL